MTTRLAYTISKALSKKVAISIIKHSIHDFRKSSIKSVTRTVQAAIKLIHQAGLPTAHCDKRGRYHLFPDGRKVHINEI